MWTTHTFSVPIFRLADYALPKIYRCVICSSCWDQEAVLCGNGRCCMGEHGMALLSVGGRRHLLTSTHPLLLALAGKCTTASPPLFTPRSCACAPARTAATASPRGAPASAPAPTGTGGALECLLVVVEGYPESSPGLLSMYAHGLTVHFVFLRPRRPQGAQAQRA